MCSDLYVVPPLVSHTSDDTLIAQGCGTAPAIESFHGCGCCYSLLAVIQTVGTYLER